MQTRIMSLYGVVLILSISIAYGQGYTGRYAPRLHSYALTAEGGVAVLGCDLTKVDDNYYLEPIGGLEFGYVAARNFRIGAFFSRGMLTAKSAGDEAANTYNAVGITGHWYWRTRFGRVNPFLFFRAGGLFTRVAARIGGEKIDRTANGAMFGGGVGIEFHPSKVLGLRIQGGGMFTTSDILDGVSAGTMNDGYTMVTAGVSYYFSVRR